MRLSFSDRAVIRLPVVMMNGHGEFISGEARSNNPCPQGRATASGRSPPPQTGRHLRHPTATAVPAAAALRGRRAPAGRGARHSQPAGPTETRHYGKAMAAPIPSSLAPALQHRGLPPGRPPPAGRSQGGGHAEEAMDRGARATGAVAPSRGHR